jgi:hypothetical protein
LCAFALSDSLLQLFGFGGDELIVGARSVSHNTLDVITILCQHPDSTLCFR